MKGLAQPKQYMESKTFKKDVAIQSIETGDDETFFLVLNQAAT